MNDVSSAASIELIVFTFCLVPKASYDDIIRPMFVWPFQQSVFERLIEETCFAYALQILHFFITYKQRVSFPYGLF